MRNTNKRFYIVQHAFSNVKMNVWNLPLQKKRNVNPCKEHTFYAGTLCSGRTPVAGVKKI